jgi:LmbE family N-acetylglucosaminyl deacetylase
MPVLSLEGAMTIVAHADDDLLFMNPDIAQSITAGEANTTVFVTGGDAGYDDAYWMGREEGIKAAYSLMAGSEDWIDEIIPIDYGGSSFELSSSTLVSAPEVRLYFLRIPDGAGAIEDPADYFSLARLEDGTLGSVTTIDDTATYSRSDLVNVLTGLMETHRPTEFRLQVAEGEYSSGEHTDHIHTTQFAEEALSQYSGTDYQVTHYVNYLSSDLPENLTDAEATLSLEVMEAYAAHDPGVTDETGALLPEYIEWTTRQYVAETATISSDTSETNAALSDAPDVITDPSPPEDGNVAQTGTYTLGDDPDSFLFDVNATTGELTPKDWFTPSLDDAWDINEDYIYEVTRIMTPADGGPQTVEIIRFDTIAEGILEPYDSGSGASDNSEPPPRNQLNN